MSLGDAFGYFGAGIGDLFSAKGDKMAAEGFDRAAGHEDLAAKITAASTVIKHFSAQRDIERTLGGQRSDIAGAGFQFSGTATDLAADSAHQGAITQALIEEQGQIDVNAHLAQSDMYRSEAAQARQKAKGDTFGGFFKIAMGIFSLFSDERLKTNIRRIGVDVEGKNVYRFNYTADPTTSYEGYLAHELDPKDVVDAVGFLSPTRPEHQSVRV